MYLKEINFTYNNVACLQGISFNMDLSFLVDICISTVVVPLSLLTL